MIIMRLALAALSLTFVHSAAVAAPPILPFRDVRAGTKAVGRTVFAGTKVETFDVEIIGTILDGLRPR